MINDLKKYANNLGNRLATVNPVVFLYFAVFLFAFIYFWKNIVQLIKPKETAEREASQVTEKNRNYLASKSITADGKFINGLGGVTKYTIGQAKQNAESLAILMNTGKAAKWYQTTASLFGIGYIARLKSILNPGYPASYRRYVREVYRDVFTNNNDLQKDVRKAMEFGGFNRWDENLTKYFIN